MLLLLTDCNNRGFCQREGREIQSVLKEGNTRDDGGEDIAVDAFEMVVYCFRYLKNAHVQQASDIR